MKSTFSAGMMTPEGTVRFHTSHFSTISFKLNEETGWCDLRFFTPESEPDYATLFSPLGVQQLTSALAGVLACMPKPPEIYPPFHAGKLEGSIPPSPDTKTYFGQNYNVEVIQALGVLMVRVNLLDQNLIILNSLITGMTQQQAHNQYYATTNMKAKLDGIKSVLDGSDLTERLAGDVSRALDRVKAVSDRRNDLVHANWSFRKGKHRAVIYRPNSKNKKVEITVTEKHVLDLAEDYGAVFLDLVGVITGIKYHRKPPE